jgi:hypothetical protein
MRERNGRVLPASPQFPAALQPASRAGLMRQFNARRSAMQTSNLNEQIITTPSPVGIWYLGLRFPLAPS